jgi:UDP-N-acetylglucosamine 2-epimerase (non-hydrolysing)
LAPVLRAVERTTEWEQIVVHSGQHFDWQMSGVLFEQLGIVAPRINLGVGSGSHSVQTAQTMLRLEPVLEAVRADIAVVYGDVNTTLAAALVCAKLGIRLAHVEAGLRSFDLTMPEEINRMLTDRVSAYLFTHSAEANANLYREGIEPDRVHLVGNVMIDSLVNLLPRAIRPQICQGLDSYVLVTFHRPSNVDNDTRLGEIVDALECLSEELPVVFPVHPRTRKRLDTIRAWENVADSLLITEPLGYLEFVGAMRHAAVVITDSGGVQEETTYLGVPCLTVRRNTERPITVTVGTNKLVGESPRSLVMEVASALKEPKRGAVPPLWDGRAAERIANVLLEAVRR